jgi:ComF family protein
LLTGRSSDEPCGECTDWPAYIVSARSAFMMHPPADRLVHQLKYHAWTVLAEPMGRWMAALRLPDPGTGAPTLLVPVASTAKRLRERGYNQAELLARVVARERGMQLANVLARTGAVRTQTALQPIARGANVAGAFHVPPHASACIQDAHLLLLDDVLTTGATVLECARALVLAGARHVSVITFARAPGARRLTTS